MKTVREATHLCVTYKMMLFSTPSALGCNPHQLILNRPNTKEGQENSWPSFDQGRSFAPDASVVGREIEPTIESPYGSVDSLATIGIKVR